MADTRETVLKALRHALKKNVPNAAADTTAERLAQRPTGPKPALAGPPLEVFVARAEAAGSSLSRVTQKTAAAQAIKGYLENQALPLELVMDSSPLLGSLPWPADISVRQAPLRTEDQTALTLAYAAVAETGSLVQLSSAESPTALNFLPDHYICLLPSSRIVAHLEDLWALMRAESRVMPRAVNLITGPSRTADVEQTIQMGAHGPRSVHIVLMEHGG